MSGRARLTKGTPSKRSHQRKILPKISSSQPATSTQIQATIAVDVPAADAQPSNPNIIPDSIPDLSLPALAVLPTVSLPASQPLFDPNALHNSHVRALLFFSLYFDMFLALAIESQSICDPSHYLCTADAAAALVLGPSTVSRTHLAIIKFQILQSFATLLTSHSMMLSLDSLFQHFLGCCNSHGLSFV